MSLLDHPADMAKLDAGRMLHFVHELPEQALPAYERGRAIRLPIDAPNAVVICGMGGSAISGDLIRSQLLGSAEFPVVVHRGDRLPAFANARSLAIIMSYSGNTAETLGCFKDAIARGVPCVVVTGGGEAGKLAAQHGFPVVSMPPGWMPRAALGDLFFALLGVASLLPGVDEPDVAYVVAQLRQLRDRCQESVTGNGNPAKALALALHCKTPVVVGATPTTEAVALRWKCQINENSKQTTLVAAWPEMTHNDIVNLTATPHPDHVIVALEDPADSEFVAKQRAISLDLIRPSVDAVFELTGYGATLISRQLTLAYLGDYASVYLGFLNGVDPTPVDTIFDLKDRMKVAMEGVRP